jgi:hypothetical protein
VAVKNGLASPPALRVSHPKVILPSAACGPPILDPLPITCHRTGFGTPSASLSSLPWVHPGIGTTPSVRSSRNRSHMANALDAATLHRAFLDALGEAVTYHSDPEEKPLRVDLGGSSPLRLRVYLYTVTDPPGGRPPDELKIQLIVPGQGRDERGSFDHSGGRFVIVGGYHPELDVFVLWDSARYPDFAWSRNVQVKHHALAMAATGAIGTQERNLHTGRETVLVAGRSRLSEALQRRVTLAVQRQSRE